MRRWSELAERVAATTRTSEKTALLAEYLPTLSAAELPIAVVFLSGRAFAEADQRATGLGWATMAAAIVRMHTHAASPCDSATIAPVKASAGRSNGARVTPVPHAHGTCRQAS